MTYLIMQRLNIDDPKLIEVVLELKRCRATFVVSVEWNAKKLLAVERALSGLKNDKFIGFLDTIRAAKVVGCIGTVSRGDGYIWTYKRDRDSIEVCFTPTSSDSAVGT